MGSRTRDRHWQALIAVAVLVSVSLVAIVVAVQPARRHNEFLTYRALETPRFAPAPPTPPISDTIATLWADLHTKAGEDFLQRLLPTQSAALWISAIVTLLVAFDASRPTAVTNVDAAVLLVVGVLLFDVLRFFALLTDPVYFALLDFIFSAVVAVSLLLAVRAVWRARVADATRWRPAVPMRTLVLLTIGLLFMDALVVTVRRADDAGDYTNLGGQRLRERGLFPYGDPLLSGSPGAAYGPVLFLAHIPFQWLFDRAPVNRPSDHPLNEGRDYRTPPEQATQLATLAFHLLAVGSLFAAARRMANAHVAWGLVAIYCASAYVLGVGGEIETVGGLTFISHTAPPALALAAFACLDWPVVAGVLLALSIATVFYPLFFIPAWLGYYSRRPGAVVRFVGGLALAAVVVGGPVLARSRALEGRSVLGTVVRETLGHHQASNAYGTTPFGFWGGRGGVRAALQREIVPEQPITTPVFLMVATLALLAYVPARHVSPAGLALLSGASAVLVEVWKILGTGVYVTWYFPFLLLGFFAAGGARPEPDATAEARP